MKAIAITETSLPLPLFQRGKVRDVYDLGEELLIVSTDRISALDFVLPAGVPDKGRVLNQMSAFWFRKSEGVIPNHMIKSLDTPEDVAALGQGLGLRDALPRYLVERSMVTKKAKRIPVECVIRGYISGSAWAEYKKQGTVSGRPMPEGLLESQQLPEPMFTPTTKGETEHDRPLTEADVAELGLVDVMPVVEKASREVYGFAAAYARERGIIIADTKFEFGWLGDTLILIDEALTPDSSRFWAVEGYEPGRSQPSYDKQPVRDWLLSADWDGKPPVPAVPADVVAATTQRYVAILDWLTK
jgi:phosphoribosylaminoimidazole-succinocarboxamide synthase